MPAAPPEITADFSPLLAERHVALAVSGGSDSIAMMRLVRDWARSQHPGLLLSVLTVDHRLRPAAAEEADRVAAWAAEQGLPHATLTWDEVPKPETGLQAKARAARYGLMAGWCRWQDAGLLLTAHTLDDQAETVLMRLSRTTSPDSLSGIRQLGTWEGLPILRPLLGTRREALRDWLRAIGQEWIEDPSNADPRFERVRVRNALALPGTAALSPERLAALATNCARAADLLERTARRWIGLWLREEEAGICHIALADFSALPGALQARILGHVISHYGGRQGEADADELRRLAAWAVSGEGAVRCTLGGAILGRRKASVWVTREAGRIDEAAVIVPESGKLLWDKRFMVIAAPGARVTPGAGRRIPGLENVSSFARLAYPWVEPPPDAAHPPDIHFQRLAPP